MYELHGIKDKYIEVDGIQVLRKDYEDAISSQKKVLSDAETTYKLQIDRESKLEELEDPDVTKNLPKPCHGTNNCYRVFGFTYRPWEWQVCFLQIPLFILTTTYRIALNGLTSFIFWAYRFLMIYMLSMIYSLRCSPFGPL